MRSFGKTFLICDQNHTLSVLFRRKSCSPESNEPFCRPISFIIALCHVFKLVYSFYFLQAPAKHTAMDRTPSYFIQGESLTPCTCYTAIECTLLNADDVHQFVKQQSKQCSRAHDVGCFYYDSPAVLASRFEDVKILIEHADCCLNHYSMSSPFPAQLFWKLCYLMLTWYHELRAFISWDWIDERAADNSFDVFINLTSKYTAACTLLGLTGPSLMLIPIASSHVIRMANS